MYKCEKCSNKRFKTVKKGKEFACRKCGHTAEKHKLITESEKVDQSVAVEQPKVEQPAEQPVTV